MGGRRIILTGLLSAAGLMCVSESASAQVTLGVGGVRVGPTNGNSVVIPYGANGNGMMVTTPTVAVRPSTGIVYSSVYNTPFGTTYYNQTTNSYYNPTVGTYNAPTVSRYNPIYDAAGVPATSFQSYSYPQSYGVRPSPASGPTINSPYPPGGYLVTPQVYRGVRTR